MQGKKRNAPCHCGSGKKYKKCCMRQEQRARAPRPVEKRPAAVEKVDTAKMQKRALAASLLAKFSAF